MEHKVQRYHFRLNDRGKITETSGRSITFDDGTRNLQVWLVTPQHPEVILEVEPMDSLEVVWPLFRKLCATRKIEPLHYRVLGPRGLGEWMPIPGGATDDPPPSRGRKQRKL